MKVYNFDAIVPRQDAEQRAVDMSLPPVRKTAYMQIDTFMLACDVEHDPNRMDLMKRFRRTFGGVN